eukprot:scaffold17342_cov130-Isochrysis_galbana.AAC.11
MRHLLLRAASESGGECRAPHHLRSEFVRGPFIEPIHRQDAPPVAEQPLEDAQHVHCLTPRVKHLPVAGLASGGGRGGGRLGRAAFRAPRRLARSGRRRQKTPSHHAQRHRRARDLPIVVEWP